MAVTTEQVNNQWTLPVTSLAMALVWLAFASHAIVLFEPPLCDILFLGLIVLLPVIGMTRFTIHHKIYFALWCVIICFGLISATLNDIMLVSARHVIITFFLVLFSFVLAGFVCRNPAKTLPVIMNGYLVGAVIAASTGIIGYFNLIPGSEELFTKYWRARGTFKDPNVLAPFLVPPLLMSLHRVLTRPVRETILPSILFMIFALAILMTFSRGGWGMAFVATLIYAGVFFMTADSNRQRVRIVTLGLLGGLGLVALIFTALQTKQVQKLWEVRVSFNQAYDSAVGGRFGGHIKALNVIFDNPFGIGALNFGYEYHHEIPHNLYLSMFLSHGWVGGILFLVLMIATLVLGFPKLFRRSQWQRYYVIAYATFVGLMVESYVIDSDHWRQFYILLAIIWGCLGAFYLEKKKPV